jgi:hypothetical protein
MATTAYIMLVMPGLDHPCQDLSDQLSAFSIITIAMGKV